MYGEDVSGVGICPGEKDCDIFQGSAGRGRAEKERNACLKCEMLPTKTDTGKNQVGYMSELADVGMYLRRRRDSGYLPGLDEITPLEFDALLMADAEIEHQEIRLRLGIRQALIAGFGLKVER